jgi:hypothetical protein
LWLWTSHWEFYLTYRWIASISEYYNCKLTTTGYGFSEACTSASGRSKLLEAAQPLDGWAQRAARQSYAADRYPACRLPERTAPRLIVCPPRGGFLVQCERPDHGMQARPILGNDLGAMPSMNRRSAVDRAPVGSCPRLLVPGLPRGLVQATPRACLPGTGPSRGQAVRHRGRSANEDRGASTFNCGGASPRRASVPAPR